MEPAWRGISTCLLPHRPSCALSRRSLLRQPLVSWLWTVFDVSGAIGRSPLEQLSGSLSRQSVASMGEPRCCIVAGNRLDGEANRFLKRLLGAGSQSTQDGFALGEGCSIGVKSGE